MADAVVHCASQVLTLIDDMAHFGDGHEIPCNFLYFFSLTVELAYRELVVLDLTEDLNSTQREIIDIVRQCLMISRELNILTESSEPPSFIIHSGTVGRPRYEISQSSLELLQENRFTVPQIARMFEVKNVRIRIIYQGVLFHNIRQ